MTHLYTSGYTPNDFMFLGEAPGYREYKSGKPFVGPAGKKQRKYLSVYNIDIDDYYLSNVSKKYNRDNPDPTDEEIEYWTPQLLEEIEQCNPKVIVTVGKIATKWMLGDEESWKITEIHGVLHEANCFGGSISNHYRGNCGGIEEVVVLPIMHPAAGLHNERMDEMVFTDYRAVSEIIKKVERGEELYIPTIDRYPEVSYIDLDSDGLMWAYSLDGSEDIECVAIDCEGRPGAPWSIQFCFEPGIAYCLRYSQSSFSTNIDYIAKLLKVYDPLIILHCANTPMGTMYDITLAREMGLDLSPYTIYDTMHQAYLDRTVSQSLKVLMWIRAGMRGKSYSDTVSNTTSQIDYIKGVRDLNLPNPSPTLVVESDGSSAMYSPRSLSSRAKTFLGKLDSYDNLMKAWDKISGGGSRLEVQKELRYELEYMMEGKIPEVTLEDIDVDEAVKYACMDPDANMRVFLANGGFDGLTKLHLDGVAVLKIAEKMQTNGMRIEKSFFESMINTLDQRLSWLESHVSVNYNDGLPFNPYGDCVTRILEKYKVKVKEKTARGLPSTSTASMGHLRTTDKMIDEIFQCRELRKKKIFCNICLKSADKDDIVRYRIAMSTVSRRFVTSDRSKGEIKYPNMLALPRKDRYGYNIREGFQCAEGYYFVAADYSQQEMRLMAHLANDSVLCGLFDSGRDVHRQTAMRIFECDEQRIVDNPEFRQVAKTINFGLIYGQGSQALAAGLQAKGLKGWSAQKCELYQNKTIEEYSGFIRWKREVIIKARETGYVEDIWEMRRYLPGIWSDDKKVKGEAERQAVNFLVQAGSQGQTQTAMLSIEKELEGKGADVVNLVHWCLQKHDEVIFVVALEKVSWAKKMIVDCMENKCGLKLKVPIKVDASTSSSWGGL